MKTPRVYNADFKNNSDCGTFNWMEIMEDATAYKYVVMYRDHDKGNGKGEYFGTADFAQLFEQQAFWFFDSERPIWQVILTDDDVPGIIAQRRDIISQIQRVELDIYKHHIPMRPNCDGRATRRTQPEAFAAWDVERTKAQRKMKRMKSKRDNLCKQLEAAQPYYSTTLYNIKVQA